MAAPPSLPPGNPLVDIHNTFGAVYIGNLFSIGLLGVTIVQAWLYYNHFPKDPIWIKMVVLAVCVVEFLRSTLTSYALYYYLVLNWGNIAGLTTLVWSLKSILVTTMTSKLLGHLFFSWRIYILSPPGRMRYLLTALVIVSTFFDLGKNWDGHFCQPVCRHLQSESFSEYTQGSQRILAPLALATSIAADAIISCCMVFVLSRSKTGFSRTNRLLNMFILYAIEAGLITVVSGTVILILGLGTAPGPRVR
ncbi:hypothetical protein PENSPDRAFT_679358 [Peniophora sp. CONT]|nr:hypothetical protein PENSPDRAFT_679358 [Peniophora sp. CONT]